ncbi:sigma-54 dependent transcriptional regulator [Mucilaginibacter sabulilitoris]|uniref:Sigma-54 dependent transcriptional regulator n=1 Tax=Mucilaginibacter sabulilitoris TaxID=1173583 RepID=A0ABZ0TEG7_9SPHI|nr:sigma-54 dependent transcriptional regulator [Mucilaginibacter sabulilitoris]WPU91589.1 sigma-54 dependent transcriptional regulator [Mucilaginibacter sabulilitoris]
MNTKVIIVEDQFIEADNLRSILRKAGYIVCKIARSVPEALKIIEDEKPNLVLLDIYLKGELTGIDLGKILKDQHIAFVYLSANSNKQILDAAKATKPYGFLVKPFREKDVLVMLDVAWYLHRESLGLLSNQKDMQNSSLEHDFKKIIGESKAMNEVLNDVKIVGTSDISVLILGESGTGKELIAQNIHYISARKHKPFVAVNCAALPANLIESELFGHEKGAFTGAIDKRIGKFEQGNEGTVFLDEIGELPLELQVKLLRVLQEKEIEPIGGRKKKVDVRIIAATNRDLEEEIAAGRFRLDLYYRINIFPISLPALRERKEDITLLTNHFLKIYAHKENKVITGVSNHVWQSLMNYDWPGNIRQLENIMARSVLINEGPILEFLKLPGQIKNTVTTPETRVKSMIEMERDHILSALGQCNGRIYGPGGAAELLELNPSTLNSRMKKLGIEKKYFKQGTD